MTNLKNQQPPLRAVNSTPFTNTYGRALSIIYERIFFSASGISFIFVPAIHEKDTKTQRENMWAPGEILLFLCSGVLNSKLPILGLFESLNFPVPRTVTWFPQTIKKTGKHDKKQVFREVLNPGVLCVFFPLFSSLDFVYCKIQRQFWIYSSSRTESFPLKCSQVQKMS